MADTITEILDEARRGAPGARDELFRVVYDELRRLAQGCMRQEPTGHTLQPTALVHETYLRLMGGAEVPWVDRAQLLGAAARAMRRILVDHARARHARKRGGERVRVALDADAPADDHRADEILAVHEALSALEAEDPERSRVVELRFFGGLEFDEIARALDVSPRTVYRLWEQARVWLYRRIAG